MILFTILKRLQIKELTQGDQLADSKYCEVDLSVVLVDQREWEVLKMVLRLLAF